MSSGWATTMLKQWSFVLCILAVSTFAAGQKKDEEPREKPAPRAERPAPRAERPAPRAERPAPRAERPAQPADRPAARPDRSDRSTQPATRPTTRPSQPTGGQGRPNQADRPAASRPGAGNQDRNQDRNQGGGRNQGGARNDRGNRPGSTPQRGPGNNAGGKGPQDRTRPASGNNRGRVTPPRVTRQVGNRTVSTDSRNRVREIKTKDMTIRRTVRGDRRIERTLPGNRRVVVVGRGRGFTERPYINRGGRSYVQRTYIVRGRPYAVAYRSYYYRGNPYYWYVPRFYYRPVFYGWVYNPWASPVYFNWGWGPDPWYGYYGYYFAPAPVYPSAALWLTDFVIGESLRAAYDARQDPSYVAGDDGSASASSGPTQLTPEVKQAIAEEVRQQLANDQQAAQSGAPTNTSDTPPALDPKNRIFVVSTGLDVTDDNGQECSLTPGDVILRTGNEVLDGDMVEVSVQSTKKGDCGSGSNVQVGLSDLQDMQNRFRQNIDAGLGQLADKQGKGLPTPPDTSTIQGEVPPPEPDADAQSEIDDEQQQADQAEKDVEQPAPNNN